MTAAIVWYPRTSWDLDKMMISEDFILSRDPSHGCEGQRPTGAGIQLQGYERHTYANRRRPLTLPAGQRSYLRSTRSRSSGIAW
jgi:hypothetical protein